MARYKYSENTKEVTDIYFDAETHGEFMGMEQGGEMKKVTTARIKEKLLGEMVLGVDWQQEVLTMTSTPPVIPVEGDRYIVGGSATGEWENYDNYIAEYTSGAWVFLAPQTRMGVFLYNDMYFLIYLEGEWQLLATLDEITELRNEVQGYRDEILNDPDFQAVSADLRGDDNIGVVADALAIITAVNNNATNITAVANNKTNINAVNANKANIDAVNANKPNIDAVANNETNITTVATNITDINSVADNEVNINAVAGNNPNITAVAENETNINAVKANETNINAVAGNSTNINAVKNNETNINAVAGNKNNIDKVANNQTNINAVALNKVNIDKVATVDAQITTLAPIKDDIVTVAGKKTEVTALGARTTEIDALYAQLPAIAEKESIANVNTLKGSGWAGQTVKGNADAIALRELLSNKKSTLLENSEVYFPNQKAVNLGLNQTMAEIMGFAPRNLMTVFGTATVAETFAELRARAITGDFSTLRLGDYVDLPSLTIGADSVNPTVYRARTINNDYNRLRVEIVGFDDYYYVGNTAYPKQHHVTMMFKDIPTTARFNETNTTTGDYPGSMLFHWLHEQFEPALISAIGIEPRAVNRRIGTADNGGWVGTGGEKIFLPTNVNIFGTTGFSHTNYGTGTQTQFALFALNPNRKIKSRDGSRSSWWLAEPSANSSTTFCYVYYTGNADLAGASYTYGVVPAFLI